MRYTVIGIIDVIAICFMSNMIILGIVMTPFLTCLNDIFLNKEW